MLDLSHLAILSKSHRDLYQIGKILHDSHSRDVPTRAQLMMIQDWINVMDGMMDEDLWYGHGDGLQSQNKGMMVGKYYSKNLIFVKNDNDTTRTPIHTHNASIPDRFDYNGSELLESYNAVDLLAGWDRMEYPDRFVSSVLTPLLDRDVENSFNCEGMYAIPSWACSNGSGNIGDTINNTIARAFIDPLMNYWISKGLKRNDANGLGTYLEESTLQLMCSSGHGFGSLPKESWACNNLQFAMAFDARTGSPLRKANNCDFTSTTSAAVFYNMMVLDKPFSYKPTPPIKNSWVIVLVVAAIIMAFSIGLSCLILSLHLMRRLNNDADQDALL